MTTVALSLLLWVLLSAVAALVVGHGAHRLQEVEPAPALAVVDEPGLTRAG